MEFDEKILNLNKLLDRANEEINETQDEVEVVRGECKKKLTKHDGTRIWRHFQRFAEYNDLKDLYSMCIPELAKFEQKLINQAD